MSEYFFFNLTLHFDELFLLNIQEEHEMKDKWLNSAEFS